MCLIAGREAARSGEYRGRTKKDRGKEEEISSMKPLKTKQNHKCTLNTELKQCPRTEKHLF